MTSKETIIIFNSILSFLLIISLPLRLIYRGYKLKKDENRLDPDKSFFENFFTP